MFTTLSLRINGLTALWLTAAALFATTVSAQTAGPEYTVDLSRAATQRVSVAMTFTLEGELEGRSSVNVLMPAWRPGRYVILDPAGGVVELTAHDENGNSRNVRKTDKATWSIESRGASSLRVNYELYANSLGLRTRHADNTHAFLSGSAVFLYVPEFA